jgi:hypothetical protein
MVQLEHARVAIRVLIVEPGQLPMMQTFPVSSEFLSHQGDKTEIDLLVIHSLSLKNPLGFLFPRGS